MNESVLSRRHWLAALLPAALGACAHPQGVSGGASRSARAYAEYQRTFLASGAHFRYHPYGGQGRAWTMQMERLWQGLRHDMRVGYMVKNLRSGAVLAEQQADRFFFGSSMPKPAISAMLLEKRQGRLSYEEFMHVVRVCDKSENSSWMALHARLHPQDEANFLWKYRLPQVSVLGNQLTPRFIAEFYERCHNHRLDHGTWLLLEAMRRDQYGFGRLFLPAHIRYAGGKTGNYGEWDHESLFFEDRGTPYAIVVFTRGHVSPGKMNLPLGALMGGLYRTHVG